MAQVPLRTLRSGKVQELAKLKVMRDGLTALKDMELGKRLLLMFDEAAQFKQQYVSQDWSNFTQFIRGANHWPRRRPTYKVSAVINFIIENIERKTALLTDTKPIPTVTPRADTHQRTADLLNNMIDLIFADSHFVQANTDVIDNAQVFGSGFLGTLYDNDDNDIRLVSYDPRAVYIDPMVMKSFLLHEGEYLVLEEIWSLEKARDLFPKKADSMKPDSALSTYIKKDTGPEQGMLRRIFTQARDDLVASVVPRVFVREFYLRDRSRGSGGTYNFKNACRRAMMVGEEVVDDGENPYNDGMFPVDMLHWHLDFSSCWGWGDVELLRNPQELTNKIVATVIENIMLMSNAIWIGDADALDKKEWDRLNNAPGNYVKKKPGRELRREPGVPLPTYVQQVLADLGIRSEKITGMVDVVRGIASGQISSGVGVESLQLMAQALIRLRARAAEQVHARVGKKLVSRIFQFYGPERVQPLLDVQANKSADGEVAITSELLKPISKRKKDAWKDVMFKIEPGSSLGLAKTQRRIESMQLRKMEVIDDEALLEDLEYPHRTEVLERTRMKRQDDEDLEVQAQRGDKGSQFPHQPGASPAGRT